MIARIQKTSTLIKEKKETVTHPWNILAASSGEPALASPARPALPSIPVERDREGWDGYTHIYICIRCHLYTGVMGFK